MAGGWSRDGAVQDQIDASVGEAIERARAEVPKGVSATHCDECGEAIAERRREAVPGVRLCVDCATGRDHKSAFSAYNRRGSKDSQLK